MSVPKEVSTLNLSGRYILDTNLAPPFAIDIAEFRAIAGITDAQAIQGIASASNIVEIDHSKDSKGSEHLGLKHSIGGVAGVTFKYPLSGTNNKYVDPLFGPLSVRVRRTKLDDFAIGSNIKDILRKNEDAVENGLIELTFASDTETTGTNWVLNAVAAVIDTSAGRRLGWAIKISSPKGAQSAEGLHYFEYDGPLKD